MIDAHCHLDLCPGGAQETIARAKAAGIEVIVDIGMGLDSSRRVTQRAEANVWAVIGFHPNDLTEFRENPREAISQLHDIAIHPSVVAIGETGIDTYRDYESVNDQKTAFEAQINLARELNLPLVIHCRDAHKEVAEHLDPKDRVIMHCFSGTVEFARQCVGNGWYCSFAGNLTYTKSSELREAARAIPENLLMIETDAPYLSPQSKRGKPNSPEFITETFHTLAEIRKVDASHLRNLIRSNVESAFNRRVADSI